MLGDAEGNPEPVEIKLFGADLQALESYLARRLDFPVETRTLLAGRMAENIARKMNFAIPPGMSQETFLEEAAFALRSIPHLKR